MPVHLTESDAERKGQLLLQQEIERSSDRACAIIAGSLVETCVDTLLKRVVTDENIWKARSNSSGAFGSFAVKIDLARLMGLITPLAHKDLVIIKDVRNRFAHDYEITDFDTPAIAAKIKNLRLLEYYVVALPPQPPADATEDQLVEWMNGNAAARMAREERVSADFALGEHGVLEQVNTPRGRFLWSCWTMTFGLGSDPEPGVPNF